MDSTILMIIIVSVGFLLIIVGILRQLDWYAIFNKLYGNNPMRCKVYIQFGENEEFVDGNYVFNDDELLYYSYTYKKVEYTVAIPMSWDFVFIRGRRKILVNFGEEFGKPLTTGDKINSNLGAELLNKSISKKLAVDMVNSIESRHGFKFALIILLVVIAAVAFFWWKSNQDKPADNLPIITTNQTIPAPTQTLSPEDQAILDQMKGQK